MATTNSFIKRSFSPLVDVTISIFTFNGEGLVKADRQVEGGTKCIFIMYVEESNRFNQYEKKKHYVKYQAQ